MVNKFVIQHPLITEKATRLSALGKYVFLVSEGAAKPEIKKAIKAIYNVDVTAVHIVNIKPKQRRLGKTLGTKPGYKKATITLKSGQKLDVLPQ